MSRLYSALNIVFFLCMVIVNYLAVYLPLGGETTGAIARSYPSLFIPPRFVFFIWWLIYVSLLGFIYFQAQKLLSKKNFYSELTEKIGPFFIISSLANIGWIFAWHNHRLDMALVLVVILLIALTVIYNRLQIGRRVDFGEKIFFHFPFSFYLGWVLISTVGNLSIFLVSKNWGGFGLSQNFWTVTAIFSLTAVAFLYQKRRGDTIFILPFIWVFFGVFLQRIFRGNPENYIVGYTAFVALVFLVGIICWRKNLTDRTGFP